MAKGKLIWDAVGERLYETGVSKAVLYTKNEGGYDDGVAWNGITAVNESPSGAEATALYADNTKYLNLISAEEYAATIEAYMYPPEFEACDGSAEIAPGVMIGQQNRKHFGLTYQTLLGSDDQGTDYGYKIHIIYDGVASPSEKSYSTVNDSPEAITFSWEVNTTPVEVTNFKKTASLTINSKSVNADKLKLIEDALYGTAETSPRLLLPDEIVAIINGTSGI